MSEADGMFYDIHLADLARRSQLTIDQVIEQQERNRRPLRVAVLFSGTRSVEKAAKELGMETFGIDNNPDLKPDLVKDIREVTAKDFPWHPDILWASPVCTGFSTASIGKAWTRGLFKDQPAQPVSDNAHLSLSLVRHTLRILDELAPSVFYMENPVAMLRAIPHLVDLSRFTRHTVTYCTYGDTAQKPTDIWTTNKYWSPRERCPPSGYGTINIDGIDWRTRKDGGLCHVSAPRGSSQEGSTQGKTDATERGRIPHPLCLEVLEQLPPGLLL